MREQLYAFEENALLAYLDRLENATAREQELAAKVFDELEDDEQDLYEDTPEGARIHIEGPLSMSGPPPIARFFGFGGTSYKSIMAAMAKARERKPRAVTLAINSPGGEVAGVDQAWQAVRAMSAEIPTTAENGGMMASAALWLASAARSIVATSLADEQGSIGVKIVAIDDSKALEQYGVKRVTIVSRNAPKKDADASTKAGRDALQERADAIESVFIARVAEGRRTTPERVAEDFGQGALLTAAEAKRVGLIDAIVPPYGVRAPQPVTAQATGIPSAKVDQHPQAPAAPIPDRRTPMTLAELIAANPGVRAEYEAALKAEREAGAASVQARITAAKPFLALQPTAKGYDSAEVVQITKLATDVIAGTEDPGALRSFVRMVDMSVEKRKLAAAQAETAAQDETPAQHTQSPPAAGTVVGAGVTANPTPQSVAQAEAELTATVARDKLAAGRAPVAAK